LLRKGEPFSMENSLVVQVVTHPHGITQGCKKCQTVLLEGNFAIGLIVKEGEESKKYLLGAPPQEHCGEPKTFFQIFQTAEEADVEKERVVAHLNEKGTTEGLRLVAWIIPGNN